MTTLRAGIEGVIYIRMTVLPSGEVSNPEVVRRSLIEMPSDAVTAEMRATAISDLEAAATQAFRTVRFEAGTRADTVTVARRFVIQ